MKRRQVITSLGAFVSLGIKSVGVTAAPNLNTAISKNSTRCEVSEFAGESSTPPGPNSEPIQKSEYNPDQQE
jgi:hypothetical protein